MLPAAFAAVLVDGPVSRHVQRIVVNSGQAKQPGRHGGTGETTAYPFFKDAPATSFEFRKRVLHRGASIGFHQHDKDEVYYVISGTGVYTLDGKNYEAVPGSAMLTRPGSTHSIRQTGAEDLVLLINYRKQQ